MENEKIIFFRNLLFRSFIIGVLFTIFFAVVTFSFWDLLAPWIASLFRIEEKELGELVVTFFMNVRIVLVYFMLTPAIALHWMSMSKK